MFPSQVGYWSSVACAYDLFTTKVPVESSKEYCEGGDLFARLVNEGRFTEVLSHVMVWQIDWSFVCWVRYILSPSFLPSVLPSFLRSFIYFQIVRVLSTKLKGHRRQTPCRTKYIITAARTLLHPLSSLSLLSPLSSLSLLSPPSSLFPPSSLLSLLPPPFSLRPPFSPSSRLSAPSSESPLSLLSPRF